MILFHAKRDGTVTTTPDLVPQGSSMQDLVVVSEFDYAYCAIRLTPASGEYIEDIPCTPILQSDGRTIWTASLPPEATVVAGPCGYQLVFTAADGTTQTTLAGFFTVPRGVPVATPPTVGDLSVKTVADLYNILGNISTLFSGHEGDITKNKTDIAQNKTDIAALKKTIASAGYVTIPVTTWEDSSPTVAAFTLDGFGKGMSALLMPADSNTQTAAREARLSASPDIFRIDDDTQNVEVIRANADKAPEIPLRFAYFILKTTDTTVFPSVAIIGVDAYGSDAEGAVNEDAVKELIKSTVPSWAMQSKPPAETDPTVSDWAKSKSKPTYTAEEVGAEPTGTAIALVDGLAKKIAADLAGFYKKDETLSKTEIGNLISAIPKFSFSVVDTLPASGLTTVVYLVPGETGTNNVYTENIYVNGRWERLGAQTLDLTGYVTEQLLNQRLYEYMTLRDVEVLLGSNLKYYYTRNEIDHQFIKLRDLPYSFPNPYPITINGVSYDGSEPVVLRLDELPIVESVEEMGDPENNENYYVLQETGQIWRARYLKGSDNWLPLAYTSPAYHTPLGGVGYRFPLKVSGSTGEESEHSTTFLTGYIPIMPGDTVRFRNIVMNSATYGCIAPYYDASGAILSNQHAGYPESTGGNIILEDNGDYSIRIPTDSAHSTARFIRIQGYYKQGVTPEIGTGIITVNEEISEVETGWHWVDTGVKYTWGNDTALLDLEQRVTDAETEIDALKKYTEFPDEVPDYWREHLSEKIKEIQTAQKNANQRCVTWAAVSDLHESSAVNTTGVIIKAVCDACDINVVLGLGDFSTRASKASEAEAINTIGYAYNNLSPILDRLLPVRGNHDGGWGTGDKTLLKPSVVDGLMSYPMHTGLEITYDAVGSGYYVTDKARKVRYIMLNTNHRGADPDATVSADGSSSYPYMSFYRITQTQMEMIRDALTTIPNDSWSVVIASHIPPIGQIDRYGDGSYVIDISAHFGDYVALRDLINAYVDREAKTITYAGTATWDKISLSVDFSEAKGHLIEYQSGHLHKYLYFDKYAVDPKTETVIGFPLRTVRCDGFQENHDDTNDSTLDDAYAAQRVKSTTSEHSFLVCVHNIDSRLTTCIHVGVQES